MDAKNKFLESYKRKTAEQNGLRFERETGFIEPKEATPTITAGTTKANKKYVNIAIGSIILLGVIVGIILIFNGGIEVIDLSGWPENDAQLWANQKGIKLQVDREYSDEVEKERIISQSAGEGARIKKGEFLKVKVSLGHDLTIALPLPDIMNMTKNQVESWAVENFMAKVRIVAEHSSAVPLGQVIRYEINDDTVVDKVTRNTPIYVIVSKGLEGEDADIILPNFKEISLDEGYLFAGEKGFNLVVEEEYSDYIPSGFVILQSPSAGEKVNKGSEIKLTISKGKAIIVPDFAIYSMERAMVLANELGILPMMKEKYSKAPSGAFISQSIKAGTKYDERETLELVYSIDNKINLPSFVGQTKDSIENWAEELNNQGADITIRITNTKSNSPKDVILHQDKANTVIAANAIIDIVVSQGRLIYVPDFVAPAGSGYDIAITIEKAVALCEELNIVPLFKEENKNGRLPGEIWHQSVNAGREITEGSTITFKYVPSDVVSVPDFRGKTRQEILAGDYNKSFVIRFEEDFEYTGEYGGKVYRQFPMANTKAASGSTITLVIGSSGMQ